MEQEQKETQAPQDGTEQTEQSTSDLLAQREAEIATLKQKEIELQKQKEHWREKYERDIASKIDPAPSEDDVFSEEGKLLKGEIATLHERLKSFEKKEARREAEQEFPILLDKKREFDEFLEDEENKKLSIKKAAKLFLAENSLLDSTPERKGLEKPTGGGQQIPSSRPSDEEIEAIRKTDYRKYEKLVREGKI